MRVFCRREGLCVGPGFFRKGLAVRRDCIQAAALRPRAYLGLA